MSAEAVVAALRERRLVLATAESCTAGLISAAITDVAGSSAVFDRGFVTYSNSAKSQMLGVPSDLITAHGAVSEQVAGAMAQGALAHSDAQIAVSVTGIAGPGGSDHKPEGRVCFGIVVENGEIKTETIEFGAIGRANVRQRTVIHALSIVLKNAKLTALNN